MELLGLARNPIPSGPVVGVFPGHDGVPLRFARWDATRAPKRGTMCVFTGRTEFIEKYFEVVADLQRRGFAVAMMDWRGQGRSGRLLKGDPRRGHVWDFAEYDRDLAVFMRDIVLPDCPPPYFALAHSMGGHIMIRNSTATGSWFDRMILVAPMLEIHRANLGAPAWLARLVIEVGAACGAGRLYVPGGTRSAGENDPFEGNVLTSDAERWSRSQMLVQAAPDLGLGSPTNGWLRAAVRSMTMLADPTFATKVKVPMLIFVPNADTLIEPSTTEAFATRLKLGTHVILPRARHEILQETDEVRTRFWAAFDAYLGLDQKSAAA